MALKRYKITGVGRYLPDYVMTNEELERHVDTNDEWIRSRTGIAERRILKDPDKATSFMATHAAEDALKDAGVDAEEIDLIIVATVTPDYLFPATAALVQKRIGAKKAFGFDLSAACSGFLFALSTAGSMIESGRIKKALVIGADKMSSIMDFTDRTTCILFGDGAGAVVLEETEEDEGIVDFVQYTDGDENCMLYQPAGGSLNPATEKTVKDRLHYIKMEGNQVFKFAVKRMSQSSIDVVNKAGYEPENVDLFIPHQANTRIINSAAKRLNLEDDEVYMNLPEYGNTSSASVPIAMAEARNKGLIKNGDKIVLVAFGAGLTWASAFLEWNEEGK